MKQPPTLTVAQVESIWSAIQALAPAEIRQPVDEAAPTEDLIAAIEHGVSYHEALRGLAWRGFTTEQLQAIMMRSAGRSSDPKRWKARYDDIERYASTAVKKRSEEVRRVFGQPAELPPGATPLGAPKPYVAPEPAEPPRSALLECATSDAETPPGNDIVSDMTHLPEDQRRAAQLEEARRIGGDETEQDIAELIKPTILNLEAMIRELVYVEGSGAVVHIPTMRVRKKEHAATAYKASKESFIDQNGSMVEKPAFPMWLESHGRASVDVITWSPRHGPICRPPESSEAGDRGVNLWKGFSAWPKPSGDLDGLLRPFHEHLEYLVPIEAERRRFIQWVAHIAQEPGVLPHTCYLMVTETTGIGRNWLTCLLASVFRGYVAAGVSLSDTLDGKFNGRLSRKLLATVDEAQEGLTDRRFQKKNKLKGIITEERREINPKYGVPSVEYNCCRWLMLSNHRDALPIDTADRRVVVIDNPTERRDAAYYKRIYREVRRPEFIGAVYHYLKSVDLSDFNAQEPAPMNEAKKAALEFMQSDVEQALIAFREGWPGEFVDYKTLTNFVVDWCDGQAPNRFHLKRVMQELGMKVTGRRLLVNGNRSIIVVLSDMSLKDFGKLEALTVINNIKSWTALTAFNE